MSINRRVEHVEDIVVHDNQRFGSGFLLVYGGWFLFGLVFIFWGVFFFFFLRRFDCGLGWFLTICFNCWFLVWFRFEFGFDGGFGLILVWVRSGFSCSLGSVWVWFTFNLDSGFLVRLWFRFHLGSGCGFDPVWV